jgi:hypothetical protein
MSEAIERVKRQLELLDESSRTAWFWVDGVREAAARIEELEAEVSRLRRTSMDPTMASAERYWEQRWRDEYVNATVERERLTEVEGALRRLIKYGMVNFHDLNMAQRALGETEEQIDAALASGKPHTSKQEGEGDE